MTTGWTGGDQALNTADPRVRRDPPTPPPRVARLATPREALQPPAPPPAQTAPRESVSSTNDDRLERWSIHRSVITESTGSASGERTGAREGHGRPTSTRPSGKSYSAPGRFLYESRLTSRVASQTPSVSIRIGDSYAQMQAVRGALVWLKNWTIAGDGGCRSGRRSIVT